MAILLYVAALCPHLPLANSHGRLAARPFVSIAVVAASRTGPSGRLSCRSPAPRWRRASVRARAEIKRAYRRLALKYHADVNKEPAAQEKFLRIKHAYNSESRSMYASSSSDLQVEFQNWEAGLNSNQDPKSLWEELAAIGEEFVEFLEDELKSDDSEQERMSLEMTHTAK